MHIKVWLTWMKLLLHCGLEQSVFTLQRVEYSEEVDKGQVEGSPGKQGEPPGEAQQHDEANDAAHVFHHPPVGSLVLGVLLFDPGQLHQDDDEAQQAQTEDQEEVGHHAHIEGDVVTQPTATGGADNHTEKFKIQK